MSSMVEDASFLVHKSLRRSVSTRSEQAIMAVCNRVTEVSQSFFILFDCFHACLFAYLFLCLSPPLLCVYCLSSGLGLVVVSRLLRNPLVWHCIDLPGCLQ